FKDNKAFPIETQLYKNSSGEVVFEDVNTGEQINSIFTYQGENSKSELLDRIDPYDASKENQLLTYLKFDYKEGKYNGIIAIDQF
ncbi:MFS transporter, partial [Aquimarina celericrescens]|nr:MFS transporter [Aquimarina celericrescens]